MWRRAHWRRRPRLPGQLGRSDAVPAAVGVRKELIEDLPTVVRFWKKEVVEFVEPCSITPKLTLVRPNWSE